MGWGKGFLVKKYLVAKCHLSEIEHFNKMESNNISQIFEGKIPIDWYSCRDEGMGELLGCFGLLVIGRTAHLRGWFVDAKYRKQGLGSQLVKQAERIAYELEYAKLSVKTAQHRIMQRMNFHRSGKVYKTFNGREYYKMREELYHL